jgi:hypothetical protein
VSNQLFPLANQALMPCIKSLAEPEDQTRFVLDQYICRWSINFSLVILCLHQLIKKKGWIIESIQEQVDKDYMERSSSRLTLAYLASICDKSGENFENVARSLVKQGVLKQKWVDEFLNESKSDSNTEENTE